MSDYYELDLVDLTPISERDKPIYEHWLKTGGWDIPDWYRNVYLKTDHWEMVKRNCVSHHEGKCHLCSVVRKPFHVHHNNYNCLWKEKFADITYLCSRHHFGYHKLLKIDKKTGLSGHDSCLYKWYAICDDNDYIKRILLFKVYHWVQKFMSLALKAQFSSEPIELDLKTLQETLDDYELFKKLANRYEKERIGETRGKYIT